jgi:hypothetical protein
MRGGATELRRASVRLADAVVAVSFEGRGYPKPQYRPAGRFESARA